MTDDAAMADVVWVCAEAGSDCAALARTIAGGACLTLHRIRWRGAYLAADDRRLVCRFRAPDAESVRLALQCAMAGGGVWPAMLVGGDDAAANLVLEREFAQPLCGDARRTLLLARAECQDLCGVEPAHVMISLDRRHAICLCRVSLEAAGRLAGIERLGGRWRSWPCRQWAAGGP